MWQTKKFLKRKEEIKTNGYRTTVWGDQSPNHLRDQHRLSMLVSDPTSGI